jgi:hypothetical protein
MANMNKKRTTVLRCDPDFNKLVNDLSRFKSNQEKEDIKASRITQAMYKQYMKYPELLQEFKVSKLGKWKGK